MAEYLTGDILDWEYGENAIFDYLGNNLVVQNSVESLTITVAQCDHDGHVFRGSNDLTLLRSHLDAGWINRSANDRAKRLPPAPEPILRVLPTKYVVEYREPKALEYIIPLNWADPSPNRAGLYFIQEGGDLGAAHWKRRMRFCVVKADPDNVQRPAPDITRSIERRIPQIGETYISDRLTDRETGLPKLLKRAVITGRETERDVIIETTVERGLWFVVEHRPAVGIEYGIRGGDHLVLASNAWKVAPGLLGRAEPDPNTDWAILEEIA